jgi:23S rRNA (uracil1939-C5)-methyltransferase
MTNDNIFDVDIISLVYGGDALGRLPDGRAVFVPGAVPGEQVRLRLVESRQRFAKAVLVEVLQPAGERIVPPHPDCPGCHYQYMTYPAQLRAKTAIVRDQLQRIAGVPQPPVAQIVASPLEWNYRNTAQFHITEGGQPGFQEPGSHRVTPIEDCALCVDAINEALPLLEFEVVPAGVERIQLRAGASGEVMLIFESKVPEPPELTVDLPVSVVHLVSDEDGSTYPVVMAGDDHLVMEAAGRSFRVSAGSFFQVNIPQAEAMLNYLLETLPISPTSSVLEVYAGVGLFSAFLAPRVAQLAAIESAASAVEDFALNLDEFDNVALYSGAAEIILPELDLQPDLVLLDPPRAGLGLPVLDALLHMAPAHLAYISCDPATLARDAKRLLAAGYRLDSVQPFDMFPQTYHIETVSLFSRI